MHLGCSAPMWGWGEWRAGSASQDGKFPNLRKGSDRAGRRVMLRRPIFLLLKEEFWVFEVSVISDRGEEVNLSEKHWRGS